MLLSQNLLVPNNLSTRDCSYYTLGSTPANSPPPSAPIPFTSFAKTYPNSPNHRPSLLKAAPDTTFHQLPRARTLFFWQVFLPALCDGRCVDECRSAVPSQMFLTPIKSVGARCHPFTPFISNLTWIISPRHVSPLPSPPPATADVFSFLSSLFCPPVPSPPKVRCPDLYLTSCLFHTTNLRSRSFLFDHDPPSLSFQTPHTLPATRPRTRRQGHPQCNASPSLPTPSRPHRPPAFPSRL